MNDITMDSLCLLIRESIVSFNRGTNSREKSRVERAQEEVRISDDGKTIIGR